MLKNHLKIAWRTILKNRGLFSINIIGLSLGIGACLTIALYVIDELSYDRFHEKSDQIARVVLNGKMGDEIIKESGVMPPVGQTLTQEVPEVLASTRIFKLADRAKVVYEGKTLRKGKMALVDPNFFEVFTFPLLKGDAKTVLSKPNSVVLTQEQAKAYFGNEDPLNKTIDIKDIGIYSDSGYVDNSGLYTVSGIIAEMPANSHFHFDLVASMLGNKDASNQSWLSGSYRTYLVLAKGANISQVESKLPTITEKYMGSQLETAMGMSFQKFFESGNKIGLYLQPLTKIHLYSDVSQEYEEGGDIDTVYMFAAIAIFMLLIACINFMNLSTAGASKRVKEIGMRKVLGSEKRQLIFQFLTESFVATLLAMTVAVLLFAISLPYFNQLANKAFTFGQIVTPQFVVAIGILTMAITLLSGGYPAFFMSGFRPIQALKNKFTTVSSKGIRSGLVVFQFAISASLIIASLVVSQQMNYIQNKDVGYNREGLLVIRDAGLLGNNFDAFKEELKNDPKVINSTTSAFVPAGPTNQSRVLISSGNESSQKLRVRAFYVDEEYIPTLGMDIVEGRNFSKEFGNEEDKILINQTAVKTFGLKGNPVGQTLVESTNNEGATKTLWIIGVVKDFNARSLHEPIEPMLMKYDPYYGLIVRAKNSDMKNLIASLESKWNSYGSGESFGYAFLDELYNETYLKEQNMNAILRIFAFLTIFVACLGLFGLVTFTAQQRFKEIGIRKVLGSSVPQIVGMLAKDFIKLVIVAMVIAFPVGYYLMNKWLQDFTYRIEVEWWVFALAALITVCIAFVTISFRSIKAALMNPVKSLRTE
ncbi:ABC transporter permease [Maribacter sp. 4G9]|uniref:ABC transporter permease n=1 Tax=Maribacter sp. 4G9 TaxID=1889777 RepID=UPI000C144D10|nr:ABC transporter permease [Maribacter sp. 4G9]PIB30601.1 cell division protein FtsX [Maribacter sp. 4G9]